MNSDVSPSVTLHTRKVRSYDIAGNFRGIQFSQFSRLTDKLKKSAFSLPVHAQLTWGVAIVLLNRSVSWSTSHQFVVVELHLHSYAATAMLPNSRGPLSTKVPSSSIVTQK